MLKITINSHLFSEPLVKYLKPLPNETANQYVSYIGTDNRSLRLRISNSYLECKSGKEHDLILKPNVLSNCWITVEEID